MFVCRCFLLNGSTDPPYKISHNFFIHSLMFKIDRHCCRSRSCREWTKSLASLLLHFFFFVEATNLMNLFSNMFSFMCARVRNIGIDDDTHTPNREQKTVNNCWLMSQSFLHTHSPSSLIWLFDQQKIHNNLFSYTWLSQQSWYIGLQRIDNSHTARRETPVLQLSFRKIKFE